MGHPAARRDSDGSRSESQHGPSRFRQRQQHSNARRGLRSPGVAGDGQTGSRSRSRRARPEGPDTGPSPGNITPTLRRRAISLRLSQSDSISQCAAAKAGYSGRTGSRGLARIPSRRLGGSSHVPRQLEIARPSPARGRRQRAPAGAGKEPDSDKDRDATRTETRVDDSIKDSDMTRKKTRTETRTQRLGHGSDQHRHAASPGGPVRPTAVGPRAGP